jgi:DNA gyrase subunit A
VLAVFPVGPKDQIMLVTDGGMVIRTTVDEVRIARRGSAGVVIFRVGDGERVVSVARLPEVASEENGENGEEASADGTNGAESEEGDGK